MWLADTSIKRPVFATVVILALVVLGIVSYPRIGVDLFPKVEFPITKHPSSSQLSLSAWNRFISFEPSVQFRNVTLGNRHDRFVRSDAIPQFPNQQDFSGVLNLEISGISLTRTVLSPFFTITLIIIFLALLSHNPNIKLRGAL